MNRSWFDDILICPRCSSDLIFCESGDSDCYKCSNCESEYFINNNVPLLIDKEQYVDFAKVISGKYSIPLHRVISIIGNSGRFILRNKNLAPEFSNFSDRHLDNLLPTMPISSESQFVCVQDYFNPTFLCGEETYRSLRIQNNSNFRVATEGSTPFHISYFIYSANKKHKKEGVRSRIPVALNPGCRLTVPVKIQIPSDEGEYYIEIMLVQEHVRWFTECILFESKIYVKNYPKSNETISWLNGFEDFSFDIDIRQSEAVYEQAIEYAKKPKDEMYILEVACGSDPIILRHSLSGAKHVACDLSYAQVQLASVVNSNNCAKNSKNFCFVCCDVANLPFREETFDIVIISAALHHFENIVDVLKSFKKVLNSGGCVVLLREPCAYAPEDPRYIEELENGYNEQQFVIDEYEVMFERAGLEVVYQQVDFKCSYKAILKIKP